MGAPGSLARVLRFGAVGALNTGLGFGVILCGLALGLGDVAANAAGYAAGLLLGFALNARWTFAGADRSAAAWGRYLLAFLSAYGANLGVLLIGREAGLTGSPFLQLAAILTYSGLFYLASSRFVFAPVRQAGSAARG